MLAGDTEEAKAGQVRITQSPPRFGEHRRRVRALIEVDKCEYNRADRRLRRAAVRLRALLAAAVGVIDAVLPVLLWCQTRR